MKKNSKIIHQFVSKKVREIFEELEYNCIPDGQSYYLRYEFIEFMYALDRFHIEYDDDFMFRYLDKLNKIVIRKYHCTDYIGV